MLITYIAIAVALAAGGLWLKGHFAAKAASSTPAPAPTPSPAPSPAPAPQPAPSPAPVAGSTLPAGIDTPDASGRVALTGLDASNYYAHFRFAIAEVGAALPAGNPRRDCLANVRHANAELKIVGMETVCYPLVLGADPSADNVDATKPIAATLALPSVFTVASATAHFAALPYPTAGGGSGFVPGH